MKKLFLSSIIASSLVAANIGVSILPQEEIVKQLMPNANIITLMPAGADPHTYEPKPNQMINLSKADVFFSIGVEVEEIWLDRINQNSKIKIIKSDENIKKQNYSQIDLDEDHDHDDHDKDHHHDANHHDEHHHDHHGLDVHIWTSPTNLKIIAQNIANGLIKTYPKESENIKKNLQKYEDELSQLDTKIKDLTKNLAIKGFVVSHPAWGYFAKEYGLTEYSLELDGKEIKPNDLAKIIKISKEKKACLILKAPNFSDRLVSVLHNESGLKISKVNPLSNENTKEILNFATILHQNCSNNTIK